MKSFGHSDDIENDEDHPLQFIGSIVLDGIAYAVYSRKTISTNELLSKHISQLFNITAISADIRLVELGCFRVPDDYQELPLPPDGME